MENSIDKLTAIQLEVGYEKGNINNIALLGLFGEAGEVLNECKIIFEGNILPSPFQNAIRLAKEVDDVKKKIRDKEIPSPKTIIENEENFDSEMADVLYYLNALAINRGKTLNDYAELSLNKVMKYKSQKDIRHANVKHAK